VPAQEARTVPADRFPAAQPSREFGRCRAYEVADPKLYDVAAPQLAVDGEIEKRPVTQPSLSLEPRTVWPILAVASVPAWHLPFYRRSRPAVRGPRDRIRNVLWFSPPGHLGHADRALSEAWYTAGPT